ncbi:DUF72 domain-containing protein [Catenuloplanes niger JCM 9533]
MPRGPVRGPLNYMGGIRVGTSGWADRELVSSGWYPREFNDPAGRLAYYAEHFDLVEVDTTYYGIPAPATARAWADRTPDGFLFNVKAFSLFTGHPTPASAVPAALRPASGAQRLRRRDLDPDAYERLWDGFHDVLAPLADTGKLGVVLLQFPPWLTHGEKAKERIVATADRCRPHRVAVELRNPSWFTDENALDTLLFLQSHDLSHVIVDMAQGLPSSVPPITVSTADPAVVRFHGRSGAWESGDKKEKFRYEYGDDELAEWASRLRELAGEGDSLHALINTCCADTAPRTALRLASLVGSRTRPSPA